MYNIGLFEIALCNKVPIVMKIKKMKIFLFLYTKGFSYNQIQLQLHETCFYSSLLKVYKIEGGSHFCLK